MAEDKQTSNATSGSAPPGAARRGATMEDLANLAEHISGMLNQQAQEVKNRLDELSRQFQAPPPPATVEAMQKALMALPYFQSVLSMMEALDQEMRVNPGPITSERVVPIAYKHLIINGEMRHGSYNQ